MPHPHDQHRYQVRLDWGIDGLVRLAPSDVVVVVDVLRYSTTVTDALASTTRVTLDDDAHAVSINGAALAEAAARTEAVVMLGCLRNASALAAAVMAEQTTRDARTSVAVVAAGELVSSSPGAALRFSVEDHLGAGAVVAALGALGIDHTSPEAAAAGEAFSGLRGALRHLLTASGSGQELIERDLRDQVLGAAELDAASVVPVLRDGGFVAY
jgi:2-phosphosulfolactate phosphatase